MGLWEFWSELEDLPSTSACPFPGLLCHLDDACVSNPCHEDAICDTNPVNGRAICTCPPGFTGSACDQDVDECSIGEEVLCLSWEEDRLVFSYSHPHRLCLFPQVPTHVSTWAGALTHKAHSCASAAVATLAHAVRRTSTNASLGPAATRPRAWTA